MFLMTRSKNNLSAQSLMCHLGEAYNSACLAKQKMMEVMSEAEEKPELCGRIESGDAYLRGQSTGGKIGRSTEDKVPFIAIVQTTEQGHPFYVCLNRMVCLFNSKPQAWGSYFLTAEAIAISDGLNCFTALASVVAKHESLIVGSRKPAWRYLAEYAYRFIHRINLRSIRSNLITGCA